MKDLLNFITDNLVIEDSIDIYADRQSLLDFRRIEGEISRTADKDTLEVLQRQQDDLKDKLMASKVTVRLRLPNQDTRKEIVLTCMSDFGLTGEEDYEPNTEFAVEQTIRLVHASVVEIEGPTGTEKDIELPAFRAFKEAIASVPSNWDRLVESYNEMMQTELISELEFKSADLS